jgi:two-component system response regulator
VLLAIEDNDADFFVIQLAVKESPYAVKLLRPENGEQGLSFLRQEGKYCNAPRPDLVLLNWHLPRKDGGEVLSEILAIEHLRSIPVIVFTSSELERRKAMALGAQDYITKPSSLDGVIGAVHSICSRLESGSADGNRKSSASG